MSVEAIRRRCRGSGGSIASSTLYDLPDLVVDELEALRQNPRAGDNGAHHAREWSRTNHVHEETVAYLIGLVQRFVQQRIVENEELVVAPIIGLVADDDVGGIVLHVVKVVENPQRGAQKAKMLGRRYLFIEDRNADRLNVFPRLMKLRNIEERLPVDAVPPEEHHGTRKLFCGFFQPGDEIHVVGDLNETLHFVGVIGRQIVEPINALVHVGQRQQIQERIEGRQDPGRKSIADEIAAQRRKAQTGVAADVVAAAYGVDQGDLGEKIGEWRQHAERKKDAPERELPNSRHDRTAAERVIGCCTQKSPSPTAPMTPDATVEAHQTVTMFDL